MRVFKGLEKGAVCIKLHEQELEVLLKLARHLQTITVEKESLVIQDFIQQSETLIARTQVRAYVKSFLENEGT